MVLCDAWARRSKVEWQQAGVVERCALRHLRSDMVAECSEPYSSLVISVCVMLLLQLPPAGWHAGGATLSGANPTTMEREPCCSTLHASYNSQTVSIARTEQQQKLARK